MIGGQLVEAIRHGFCMSDWGDSHSKDGRSYFADSESLMEGGIGEVILEMRSVLEVEGVRIDSVGDDLEGEVYAVAVNGGTYPIYDEELSRSGLLRGLATKGLREIVNGLLQTPDPMSRSSDRRRRRGTGNPSHRGHV